jgi:hypothetical protein
MNPNAAALIRQFDPALASLWISSPFQRHNIVSAMHRSLTKCGNPLADEIAVALRSAIDQSQAQWKNISN